jgi:hypothetical protein
VEKGITMSRNVTFNQTLKFEESIIKFKAQGLEIENIYPEINCPNPVMKLYVSMPEFSEIDTYYDPVNIVMELKKTTSLFGNIGSESFEDFVKVYLKIRKGEVWTREMEEQTTLDNLVGLSVLNILDKSGYEV